MKIICSYPNPFPFKNMAIRQRIIYLSEKNRFTFITRKYVEVPAELTENNSEVIRSPYHFSNNYIDMAVYLLWAFLMILRLKNEKNHFSYSFQEISSILIGFMLKFFGISRFWVIDFLDDPDLELNNWLRRKESGIIVSILKIIKKINRIILKKSDLQIVQGMSLKDKLPVLLNKEYDISFDTMETVSNGVDLKLIKADNKLKPENQRFDIFYVGYVSELRGIGTLINTILLLKSKIPDIHLTLVGHAKEQDKKWLKDRTEKDSLQEKITFTGVLESEKVWEYIGKSDICVYPFKNQELSYVLPVKVFEYLALDKPVIASNLEGVSYIIKHGYNGLLVDPGDPEKWAEAVYRIYTDKSLKEKLIGNARKSIEKFDWKTINNAVNNRLVKLLSD
jgi:glycosyltransferase involved in cell wall biosynthesis